MVSCWVAAAGFRDWVKVCSWWVTSTCVLTGRFWKQCWNTEGKLPSLHKAEWLVLNVFVFESWVYWILSSCIWKDFGFIFISYCDSWNLCEGIAIEKISRYFVTFTFRKKMKDFSRQRLFFPFFFFSGSCSCWREKYTLHFFFCFPFFIPSLLFLAPVSWLVFCFEHCLALVRHTALSPLQQV